MIDSKFLSSHKLDSYKWEGYSRGCNLQDTTQYCVAMPLTPSCFLYNLINHFIKDFTIIKDSMNDTCTHFIVPSTSVLISLLLCARLDVGDTTIFSLCTTPTLLLSPNLCGQLLDLNNYLILIFSHFKGTW